MTTIIRKLGLLIAVFAITAGATNAFGSTLTLIPIPSWLSGTNVNEGRAISPDGKYVVGVSGTSAAGGFLYDLANDAVIQPNAVGAVPSVATGIAYRTDPVSSEKQLIIDGMSAGYQANWMTTDGGATWGAKRRNTSFTQANVLPTVNSLGAAEGQDAFYQTIRNSTSTQVYVNQGSNNWNASTAPAFNYSVKGIPTGDSSTMNGVAATGRAVGKRNTATIGAWKNNYILDWNGTGTPTPWYLNNLVSTTEGEAFSVSADGNKIFGQSPVGDRLGYWPYKAIVTSDPNSLQTIDELPTFGDTAGSSSLAVPYGCSADGRYAVGMNYRGTEKAVLWDTGDASPANWTVVDLTDLATSEGVLGGFTRLSRGYSVGVNAAGYPVITGVGIWSPDGGTTLYTRAFVMVVSPATAPVPHITSLIGAGTTSVTVNYTNTVNGINYVVQYRTNLNTTNWTSLAPVTASGTTSSSTDTPAGGTVHRFYRVYGEF